MFSHDISLVATMLRLASILAFFSITVFWCSIVNCRSSVDSLWGFDVVKVAANWEKKRITRRPSHCWANIPIVLVNCVAFSSHKSIYNEHWAINNMIRRRCPPPVKPLISETVWLRRYAIPRPSLKCNFIRHANAGVRYVFVIGGLYLRSKIGNNGRHFGGAAKPSTLPENGTHSLSKYK